MESIDKGDIPEWRPDNRARKVDERKKEGEPTKFYHASTKKFRVGEVVVPGATDEVCLTTEIMPHETIIGERILPEKWYREARIEDGSWRSEWDGKWWIYEVEPLEKVYLWPENREAKCALARVVRIIGDARAIAEKKQKELMGRGKDKERSLIGSKVENLRNVRGDIVKKRTSSDSYWEVQSREYRKK